MGRCRIEIFFDFARCSQSSTAVCLSLACTNNSLHSSDGVESFSSRTDLTSNVLERPFVITWIKGLRVREFV